MKMSDDDWDHYHNRFMWKLLIGGLVVAAVTWMAVMVFVF